MGATANHVLLAAHLVALTFGAGVIAVAFQRSDRRNLRHLFLLALSLTASSVMMLADTLATYNAVADQILGAWTIPLSAAVTAVGAGLSGWAMTGFIFAVLRLAPSLQRHLVRSLLAVLFAVVGVWSWVVPAPLRGVPVGVGLAVLNVALTIFLLANWGRVERRETRRFLVRLYAIVFATTAGMVAQILLDRRFRGLLLDSMHPVQLISYLAIAAVLLHHVIRELPLQVAGDKPVVPEVFSARYGISPREAEIVVLILQGYRNREIGALLFISDRTVKNHVYSIYQKTGAASKMQLANMVRAESSK